MQLTFWFRLDVIKNNVLSGDYNSHNFENSLYPLLAMYISLFKSELLWAWKGWRDEIGPYIRDDWYEVVKLQNKGAREHSEFRFPFCKPCSINGSIIFSKLITVISIFCLLEYKDEGEYLRELYEDPSFVEVIDALWKDIEPMYKQLHAYVRYKLHGIYKSKVDLQKAMPAHLFGMCSLQTLNGCFRCILKIVWYLCLNAVITGDMWAMKWDALLDRVEPYPEVGGFDVTKGMIANNFTTMQMFTMADKFYQSMGKKIII